MLIYLSFEDRRDYEIINYYLIHVEGGSHFNFHFTHGWVCNIIFTLPRTSDYYVQNIVNIRMALAVIGEESICNHLRFWGFLIFSVSAKTESSDETVRVQSI